MRGCGNNPSSGADARHGRSRERRPEAAYATFSRKGRRKRSLPRRLLLLPRPEIRLPAGFLATGGRGGHLDLVFLRFLGLAIAALLAFCHVALLGQFELVEFVRLHHLAARGADAYVLVAFAQPLSRLANCVG